MVAKEAVRKRKNQWQFEIDEKTGCWNWLRAASDKGYGNYLIISKGAMQYKAHRVYFQELRAKIPNGLTIDHLCRNTKCVNPNHLEPVSMRENLLRGNGVAGINYRKTHCIHGHKFTPENTRPERNGRSCRACKKIANNRPKP